MPLPTYFCWSRFGAEAGQGIEDIIERKEEERLANGGVFLWGIGNPIGPSIMQLLRCTAEPEVIFSPIKGVPREDDKTPSDVAAWVSAKTLEGTAYALPKRSLVTSRYDPASPKKSHYALVCFSDTPLEVSQLEERISARSIVNIISDRPVGASQVTAVVKRKLIDFDENTGYHVSMRVRLVYPYFLILTKPLLLSKPESFRDWSTIIRTLWKKRGR